MSVLVTTDVFNTKISQVENEIPTPIDLMITTVLNTKNSEVENEIFDNSKYITAEEFSKLKAKNFAARLKQADLVNKTDFDS